MVTLIEVTVGIAEDMITYNDVVNMYIIIHCR